MYYKIKILALAFLAMFAIGCSKSDDGPSKPPPEIVPPEPDPGVILPVMPKDEKFTYYFEWKSLLDNYTFQGTYFRSHGSVLDKRFDRKLWDVTPKKIVIVGDEVVIMMKTLAEYHFKIKWENNVGTIENADRTVVDYFVINKDKSLLAIYINMNETMPLSENFPASIDHIEYTYRPDTFITFWNALPNKMGKKGTYVRNNTVFKRNLNEK
ncbi:hypothetical protein [Myroides phaeus]|uniref:Lipoprotein n=1 Tax=Myroides phaeus TaxID=702745 RepID=A0A1G8CK84_9FLAO|nr:hypothetical protein [Myroides phaeus]SDH45835.1 hypothetical protein SAMN05421818_10491 [Myroides phaeus]